jgi:integrase
VHRIYGTLRAAFGYAVAADWLGRTPCRDINLPARRRTARPTITPDDVIALADAMRPEYAPMVWVGIVTGLRWGEVAGLRVGHLDLLRRAITVAEQVARGPGGITIIDAPKSEAGNRVLTIPTQLADLLAAHIASRGLTLAVYAQATAEGDREAADKLGARFMTRTGATLTVVPADKR